MKKAITVPLMILVLFSGISLKYSAHLCGGAVVATMFSLKDEVAKCSMDDNNGLNPGVDQFKTGCCDNLIAYLQIKTNFIPSTISNIEKINALKYFSFIPYFTPVTKSIIHYSVNTGLWPPGRNQVSTDSPEALCIFRI